MAKLGLTPSQTVGPFFAMKLESVVVLAGPRVAGERIRIVGLVRDGDRHAIEDALVEVWQANAAGRYRHPADGRSDLPIDEAFTGYGRAHVGFEDGEYAFETIKPGPVPGPNGDLQAPHMSLIVTARGLLKHCHTRLYFGDEVEANAGDLVLGMVPESRRETLIAERVDARPIPSYRFDIRFQGEDETVFFAL